METIEELIKHYEKELLFCDRRIEANLKHKEYIIAHNYKISKLTILEFIDRLKLLNEKIL